MRAAGTAWLFPTAPTRSHLTHPYTQHTPHPCQPCPHPQTPRHGGSRYEEATNAAGVGAEDVAVGEAVDGEPLETAEVEVEDTEATTTVVLQPEVAVLAAAGASV